MIIKSLKFSILMFQRTFFLGIVILSFTACDSNNPAPTEVATPISAEQPSSTIESNGYPVEGYPIQEEISAYPGMDVNIPGLAIEAPNPGVELPATQPEYGVVGGVLVEEIPGQGFRPLQPLKLSLAKVVYTSEGEPAYIGASDTSPKAEIFATGIFVFRDIPPGDYGIMIDVGYKEFPVTTPDGQVFMITVEAGKAIDLGQVITVLPTS